MKPNTTNIRYYELTASEFDWKVSENTTVKAWGFNNNVHLANGFPYIL